MTDEGIIEPFEVAAVYCPACAARVVL